MGTDWFIGILTNHGDSTKLPKNGTPFLGSIPTLKGIPIPLSVWPPFVPRSRFVKKLKTPGFRAIAAHENELKRRMLVPWFGKLMISML